MPDIGEWSLVAADNGDIDTGINWEELQPPDSVNNSARAMMARLAQAYQNMRGGIVTGGVADAYTVAVTSEPTSLAIGWVGLVKFHAANTGASTFKIGTLAAQDLRTINGAALPPNTILTNSFHLVIYDTVNGYYRLVSVDPATFTGPNLQSQLFAVAGGTADAITATFTPALVSGDLIDGLRVYVRAGASNTTRTPTFNPNGTGALGIKRENGTFLMEGDIYDGQMMSLVYRLADTTWYLGNPYPFNLTFDDNGIGYLTYLQLNTYSNSPAPNDGLGGVLMYGRDSVGNRTEYVSVDGMIVDPTDGSEDGALFFGTRIGGAKTARFWIGAGVYSNANSDKGVDTVNFNDYYRSGNLGTIMPGDSIRGLILSRDAGDPTNDISITFGQCTAEQGNWVMNNGGTVVKRLDASWVVGTGQGGLDGSESVPGTPDVSTWYHVHCIARSDTGVTDFLFSESATAPTLPAGYDRSRRIGAVFNDSGGNIRAFSQNGDEFLWDAVVIDVDDDNPGVAAVTRTLSVPLGVKINALCQVGVFAGTTAINAAYFSSLDVSDQAPTAMATATLGLPSDVWCTDTGEWHLTNKNLRTNTSAQVRSRLLTSGAADRIGMITLGWIDPRGRKMA